MTPASTAIAEPELPHPITGTKTVFADGVASAEGSLLALLLDERHRPTPVERFARRHENYELPRQARYYRDLIPSRFPADGEQFAFEVDLDACSGCKACVTACHNLNGLEPEETWRGVGLLYGGTTELPVVQHVTTACHHCLEPACLDGCPVLAYEKDPITGIVRHLDDQCIGCQYCILKCPYDVPKYSSSKGIVRKCDLCTQRLTAGEAPACVQACPHEAIRIAIVNRRQAAEECEANLFLPGAPEPGYTLPTTVYKSARPLPRNLLPSDYYAARPQHAHWPLILMLVFTQASVGALVLDRQWAGYAVGNSAGEVIHRGAAFLLGLLGLTAAVFHLGRPRYAYRAWIGLRTSWLSREILVFGVFAGLASAYAAVPLVERIGFVVGRINDDRLGAAVAVTGILGVYCSAMIYAVTHRPFWHWSLTIPKFLLTGVVLGAPTALLVAFVAAAASGDDPLEAFRRIGPPACRATIAASTAKLLLEAGIFAWLGSRLFTPLKRTAVLMTGELGLVTFQRYFTGLVGGVVLPWLLLHQATSAAGGDWLYVVLINILTVAVAGAGELLERYLFFTAVVAPKMPGVPVS
jgi:Fe-S-cluster-containing dehydrogenase component/DMSO reductase anchor subunit